MRTNKKTSDLFGILCVAAIFAGCVEGLDGGPTAWNFVCLAAAFVFGWLSKKTEPKKEV